MNGHDAHRGHINGNEVNERQSCESYTNDGDANYGHNLSRRSSFGQPP
jgi:hypothetical protein